MVKTYYYAVDKDGQGWYYDNPPIFDGESWNVDPTWIGEFDLRATYGVGFVESLPDIANGEMTEIRIKYTAEKCE